MNVFEFKDYKKYISSYVEALPSKGRGEFGRWSKEIRIHSSLLSQIVRGDKHFTQEQALSLCDLLGLIQAETEYFIALVQMERSGTQKLRSYWLKIATRIKDESMNLSNKLDYEKELDDHGKAIFYSSWQYSAIRLAASLPQLNTLEDIAQYLDLPRNKVKEIMDFLLQVSLCKESADGLKMGPSRTHLDRHSKLIQQHHRNWRLRAINRQELLSDEELCFSGPLSIDREGFNKIKLELSETIDKVSKTVKKSDPELLGCLNIDWFYL